MNRVLTPTEANAMFAAIDEVRTNRQWRDGAQPERTPGFNGHTAPATVDDVVDIDAVLDQVLADLRDIEDQLADLERRKGALREVLVTQIGLTGGDPVMRPLATVKFAPLSERVTYDRRALDALAASDATLAGILTPHRKVTVVPPSLRVEWRKEATR